MINIIIVVIRHNHKINLIKAEILWRCAVLIDIHDYVSSLCSVAKLNGHQEPYTIANVHYSIRTRILCQHCCGHANRILCNFSVLYSELVFDHANERWKHGLHWPPSKFLQKPQRIWPRFYANAKLKFYLHVINITEEVNIVMFGVRSPMDCWM